MADLRKLAEARARLAAASPYPWRGDRHDGTVKYDVLDANGETVVHGCNGNEDPAFGIYRSEDEAFIVHAAQDLADALAEVDRLTLDLNAYRAFAVSIARMVASPGAEDLADKLTAEDLDTLGKVVQEQYNNGHRAGDDQRFRCCKYELARALGLDVRRAPDWGEMVASVRGVVRRDEAAASRWRWTVATTPGGGAILSYRAPGQSGFALIASALPRKDGMLAVSVLGQKRTAADDLPAALATIRAVLGGDVPEIPNERSES